MLTRPPHRDTSQRRNLLEHGQAGTQPYICSSAATSSPHLGEISFAAELLQAVQVDLADTSAGRWLWRLPPPTDASC